MPSDPSVLIFASTSPLERWASGSNLSLNILTKGNSTGGRIPHPRRTICRRPARRPVHEDGGDPRRRGVLDGGRRHGSLGSSTVGGGTPPWRLDGERRGASLGGSTAGGGAPPWSARRRAEACVPGRLDGERRGASLSGSTAGAGGLLAHGNGTSAREGDGCARKAGWRTAGSRQRSLPAFPGWRRRNRSHKFSLCWKRIFTTLSLFTSSK